MVSPDSRDTGEGLSRGTRVDGSLASLLLVSERTLVWKSGDRGLWRPFVWIALDFPGLRWFFHRLADPTAAQQLSFLDGKLIHSSGGKTQQLRWFPERGFKENEKFFFLRTPEGGGLDIPKRAFSPDQQRAFRELLQRKPVSDDAIDCHFVLTETG
jgi:hypothetical protein